MNIITLAFDMAAAVEKFLIKAKRFYYLVMLFGYRCPKRRGSLMMVTEGTCRCKRCSYEFDPTIEFQRCLDCGGVPIRITSCDTFKRPEYINLCCSQQVTARSKCKLDFERIHLRIPPESMNTEMKDPRNSFKLDVLNLA